MRHCSVPSPHEAYQTCWVSGLMENHRNEIFSGTESRADSRGVPRENEHLVDPQGCADVETVVY